MKQQIQKAGNHDFGRVTAALRAYQARTGQEPLMLGGWEVEDTRICPPACLVERLSAIKAKPKGYAYARDFTRAKARAATLFQSGIRFESQALAPENIVILQNSSQGLLLALTALREQGVRHAVIAAPCYFAAISICQHLGLDVTLVPAAHFLRGTLNVSALVQASGRRPSVVIVTNPAYSLGVEYSQQQLQALFAALPDQATLLLDETRLGLHWQHDWPWYSANFPRNTLLLRSPSKIFLLNGLKTSLLFGPAEVLHSIEKIGEVLVGSVAGNAEQIALAYLECWQAWLAENRARQVGPLRRWKAGVVERLRQNLGMAAELLTEHGCTLSPVDSGPYVLAGIEWQDVPALESTTIAQERGVLLMTSEYFYHHSPDWLGFRLNLCGDAHLARQALARVFSSSVD